MKKIIFLLTLLTLSTSSVAKPMAGYFGLSDTIERIQSVDIKGPKGELLDLSYHTQTRYFGGGVYIADKGYVFTVRGKQEDGASYYPLTYEIIAEYQADNVLPIPMPEYKISTFDYIKGYSLWIFLAIAGILSLFMKKHETE